MGSKNSKQHSNTATVKSTGNHFNAPIVRESVMCMTSMNGDLYHGNQAGEVEVFDLEALGLKGSWKLHTKAICKMCVCTSNGMYFTASRDKTLNGRMLFSSEGKSFCGHTLAVTAAACNHDGSQLLSGGRDCTVALWDVNTASKIRSESVARNLVTDIKWRSGGNVAVQCSEDKIMKLWDTRTLKSTASFPMKQYFQNCCDVSDDDVKIITGSVGGNGNGCELILWDVRQMEQISALKGHSQNITSCVFYGTGQDQRIITTSSDCSVMVWDPIKLACTCTYYVSGAEGLTSSVVMEDGSIYVGSLQGGIHKLFYNHSNGSLTHKTVF